MTIPDETLMAFADGELHGAELDVVAKAVNADPELQSRVDDHRALRTRLQQAFADQLTEAVPERLISAARRDPSRNFAAVVDLHTARAVPGRVAKRAAGSWRAAEHRRAVGPWRAAGIWRTASIAASLLIGFAVGYLALQRNPEWVRERGGELVASGALAEDLSQQLAADRSGTASVRVGVSFLAKSGEYCRTFSTVGNQASSGLACRRGRDWLVQALVRSPVAEPEPQTIGFRTAGSSISPLILQLVDQQIAGEPLDEQHEATAKRDGWVKAPR